MSFSQGWRAGIFGDGKHGERVPRIYDRLAAIIREQKMREPEIITVSAGPCTMGVPEFPHNAKLVHRWRQCSIDVAAFGISKYPLTVAEYLQFAAETGYPVATEIRTDPRFRREDCPAAFVSWIDAVRYTQWLAR